MLAVLFNQVLTLGLGLFMMLCGSMGAISAFNSLRLAAFAPPFHPRRQGRIMACGLVRPTDPSQLQTAPLSQIPCLAYQFSIVESRGRNTKAYLHSERRGQWNLSIHTPSGVLPVTSCELDLNNIHLQDHQHLFAEFENQRAFALLSENNISPNNMAGMRRSLTLRESILRSGDRVYLIGRQQWSDGQRTLKNAVITDKPISQFILKASVMLVASAAVVYISTGVIHLALR